MSVNTGKAVPSTFGGMAIVFARRGRAIEQPDHLCQRLARPLVQQHDDATGVGRDADHLAGWPRHAGDLTQRVRPQGRRRELVGVGTIGAAGAPPSNTRRAVRPAT